MSDTKRAYSRAVSLRRPALANERGQGLPGPQCLHLESGRLRARCLEQKLLPTLSVDLPQQLVDLPAVLRPVLDASHAASCNSGTSTSPTRSRAGRRKTPTMTIDATSSPPRTSKEVWKPLTAAAPLPTATPCECA